MISERDRSHTEKHRIYAPLLKSPCFRSGLDVRLYTKLLLNFKSLNSQCCIECGDSKPCTSHKEKHRNITYYLKITLLLCPPQRRRSPCLRRGLSYAPMCLLQVDVIPQDLDGAMSGTMGGTDVAVSQILLLTPTPRTPTPCIVVLHGATVSLWHVTPHTSGGFALAQRVALRRGNVAVDGVHLCAGTGAAPLVAVASRSSGLMYVGAGRC